jgi:hypothetical protein
MACYNLLAICRVFRPDSWPPVKIWPRFACNWPVGSAAAGSSRSTRVSTRLIPEFVPAITAVTTARPQILPTPLGRFEYRHISSDLFWGFQRVELPARQEAFVADPEKAFLDLVYLTPGGERPEFLRELRLQNLGAIRREVLEQYAEKSGRPKLKRAVLNLQSILDEGEGVEL